MLEVLIEISRGGASLWVFLFHLRPAGAASPLWALGGVGDLGVPAFFVISGFCIYASARSAIAAGRPASSFLRRRLRRIYPPFWAAVAVAVAVPYAQAALFAVHSHRWQTPQPLWSSYSVVDWALLLSLGRVFFSHGRSLDTAFNAVNAVYWSLAIEVQFYFVVALALCWRRHFHRILGALTVAAVAGLCFPAMRNCGFFLVYWPMFAAGGLLFLLVRRLQTQVVRWWRVAGCLLALTAVAVAYADHAGGVANLIYYTIFAALFALLLASLAGVEASLAHLRDRLPMRALLALGASSYSLYLLHAVLMHVPATALWVVAGESTRRGSLLWGLLVIVPTILLAYGFYRVCERPFISSRSAARKLPESETEAAVVGDAMEGAALAAGD